MSGFELLSPKFKFIVSFSQNDALPDMYGLKNSMLDVFAEGYEVKEGGSATFYQVFKMGDKLTKVPVFSCKNWTSIVLEIADSFPVLNQSADIKIERNVERVEKNDIPASFLERVVAEKTSHTDVAAEHSTTEQQATTPGASKKAKEEALEAFLVSYLKTVNNFSLLNFMMAVDGQLPFKVKEEDVSWAVGNILKNRIATPQKFIVREAQRVLDMHAPGIIKRHWVGKMSPIMDILQEKDETRNISQIDLAVWLSLNGYF